MLAGLKVGRFCVYTVLPEMCVLVHKMNYNGDIYTNQDGILSDPVDDLIKIMIYTFCY